MSAIDPDLHHPYCDDPTLCDPAWPAGPRRCWHDAADAILASRQAAHRKHYGHGVSIEELRHDDFRFLPILIEEVGEVADVLNELTLGNIDSAGAKALLSNELLDVAAVVVSWLDAVERPR